MYIVQYRHRKFYREYLNIFENVLRDFERLIVFSKRNLQSEEKHLQIRYYTL